MKIKKSILDGLLYGLLYFSLILLFLIFEPLKEEGKTRTIQICMIAAISIVLILSFIIHLKNKVIKNSCEDVSIEKYKSRNEVIVGMAILMIGLIMRVGYTMYTPWYIRVHDVGQADLNATGHASYILHLFYGKLPNSNEYQFYHPPFYHFLSSVTMHIVGLLKGIKEGEYLIDSAKLISCFASCGVLIQIKLFLKDIDIKEKIANIIMLIVAFCPNFYLMAGRVNNDALVFFFMVVAIRYTYKWYYNQDWKSIIILAIAYGLGMMTKTSMAVLAVFTAVFMCVVLVKNIKKHLYKMTILQLIVFGVISLPLGLWYPIRNLILYKQPLSYVLNLGKESPIYVGNYSMSERLLLHIKNLKNLSLFNEPIDDYNIPIYIWKGSLFGEFTLEINNTLGWILLISNGVLIVISIIAMIAIIMKTKEKRELIYGLFFIWLCQIISYISFNINFPHACTMDFRYIVTTVIVGAIFIGLLCQQIASKKNIVYGIGIGAIYTVITIYAIASMIVYLLVK